MEAPGLLGAVFNHVVLPACVPQKEDDLDPIDRNLIDRLITSVRQYIKISPNNRLDWILISLQSCKALNVSGGLQRASLLTEFQGLRPKAVLILYIKQQNAGLLVRRSSDAHDQTVTFEAFEASPRSEDVLASVRLQWDFPGSAVKIPASVYDEPAFQGQLASFLESASTESIKRFAATTSKAGSTIFESRGTTDPALITQDLLALLEANGAYVLPNVLSKRIRDEVAWSPGALNPWRRSPFWLILRFGVQRHIQTLGGSNAEYKILMCLLHLRLLEDADELLKDANKQTNKQYVSLESVSLLQTKLARRLLKLDAMKESAVSDFLKPFMPEFQRSMMAISISIANSVKEVKSRSQRQLSDFSRIPAFADHRDLVLTLPNSRAYLQQVISHSPFFRASHQPFLQTQWPLDFNAAAHSAKSSHVFAKLYSDLSDRETELENKSKHGVRRDTDLENFMDSISAYLDVSAGAYASNTEQKSVWILTVMEAWCSLDRGMVRHFPLLEKFCTGFSPESLDVLLLSSRADLSRLQHLQTYINKRNTASDPTCLTIFHERSGSFAARYFDESSTMQETKEMIESRYTQDRTRLESEWRDCNAEELRLAIATNTASCLNELDIDGNIIPHHEIAYRCPHCRAAKELSRYRRKGVRTIERPLPSDAEKAKIVVFELACPELFAAFRALTWRIMVTVGMPRQKPEYKPPVLLHTFHALLRYVKYVPTFSLASRKKDIHMMHYRFVPLPVHNFESLCRENTFEPLYYDTVSQLEPVKYLKALSFEHYCCIVVPSTSPFATIANFSADFAVYGKGPTSNSIIASQLHCPTGSSSNEFMAFQNLYHGKHLRLPNILTELGAQNLNFSTEAVANVVSGLVLQAGPAFDCDELRTIHGVFSEDHFCRRFVSQLSLRLDGISNNWRDATLMTLLTTLALRVTDLSPPALASECLLLVDKVRLINLSWLGNLRSELNSTPDPQTFHRCSTYALWAALNFRRTLASHANSKDVLHPSLIRGFIESSITIFGILPNDISTLPLNIKSAVALDFSMLHRMRFLLLRSLQAEPDALVEAFRSVWPGLIGEEVPKYSNFRFLDAPHEFWCELVLKATSEYVSQRTIHYNFMYGSLTINNQILGVLPLHYRTSSIWQLLFDNHSVATFPSEVPGMDFALAIPQFDHQIHLGMRNNEIIVRAIYSNTLLELIPHTVFLKYPSFDLPVPLVENCGHWLDLKTHVVEIRKSVWKPRSSNWFLNLNHSRASRITGSGIRHSLFDPSSLTVSSIARCFEYFELPSQLTVYRPDRYNLSVELTRLELTFFVNRQNLLESRQLDSYIDPNQDFGTWHGLKSAIVLQHTKLRQRSVIVPRGSLISKRVGHHVEIFLECIGVYGMFKIDSLLGRIESPAVEQLLYLKAQLHAYTSLPFPDTLTGRTGTEEALACLSSSSCDPWRILDPPSVERLMSIAKLTPNREYYPKGHKFMQTTSWNPQLTSTIQHDSFHGLTGDLIQKSNRLALFQRTRVDLMQDNLVGDAHLLARGFSRRGVFQRPNADSDRHRLPPDLVYDARDRFQETQRRRNIWQGVGLVRGCSSNIAYTGDLAGILQEWSNIGSFAAQPFAKSLLSDVLSVDMALEFGSLLQLLRTVGSEDGWRLQFLVAQICSQSSIDMDVIRVLLAYRTVEDLRNLETPTWPEYTNFRQDDAPRFDEFLGLIKYSGTPYPTELMTAYENETNGNKLRKLRAQKKEYDAQVTAACHVFINSIIAQWPCPKLTIEDLPDSEFMNSTRALGLITERWAILCRNRDLCLYIRKVQAVLDQHRGTESVYTPQQILDNSQVSFAHFQLVLPSLQDLLRKMGPPMASEGHSASRISRLEQSITMSNGRENLTTRSRPTQRTQEPPHTLEASNASGVRELAVMINQFSKHSESAVRAQYGNDLLRSLDAFMVRLFAAQPETGDLGSFQLEERMAMARKELLTRFDTICAHLEEDQNSFLLRLGTFYPPLTRVTLLETLRSTGGFVFGNNMRESLVEYGVALTTVQRLLRMDGYQKFDNKQRFQEELMHQGHGNWQPLEMPDWLLLEIDANILIRDAQVEVARATISPSSKSNSLLQMNMGQGKTSVILPMVACALADSRNLLKVIVPKALLLQTAQLLQNRLGNLVGRSVKNVPFSRKTPTDSKTISTFHQIHKDTLDSSGVMLALPEHLMSFRLSGLQLLSDSRIGEARQMIQIQKWIDAQSRDVLDESDYCLSLRTQLIYPSGSSHTLDGYPHRWTVIQHVLKLVHSHLWNLKYEFIHSLEIISRPLGGFPIICFLRKDVEKALLLRLVENVCSGLTPILPRQEFTDSDRQEIRNFISIEPTSPKALKRLRKIFPDDPAAMKTLLILRGLFVYRTLLTSLKKRWNVQYGLHPSRNPIAVPYYAKGVPSEQAEWGHPDISILLTTLSFYYQGLTPAQLRSGLQQILKSDDPQAAYDRWVCTSADFPDSLKDWSSINVDDELQLSEIWDHVRLNVEAIDYFLNKDVFPRYAKSFEVKLQASSWDIPLFSEQNLTTGFSGTNDIRHMLPLTISQEDLSSMSHTNSEVLTYFLQKRNRTYKVAADIFGNHLQEIDLLRMIDRLGACVLIDAGSNFLEMTNAVVAREWLNIADAASAAVYWDEETNRPWVLHRHGIKIPLHASPFQDDLGKCCVYIDNQNCRGTDLKLGVFSRGAITLGLDLTKDAFVQAALRLRQLATTQSIVFIAPPEVNSSICDFRRKSSKNLDSADVIAWLLEQSCINIETMLPVFVAQDFIKRTQAALDNISYLDDAELRAGYLSSIRSIETQSLEDLYGPRSKPRVVAIAESLSPKLALFTEELARRIDHFQDTGDAVQASVLQEVEIEQEREVEFEVETVREVQIPVKYETLKFSLHRDIITFVRTGRLIAASDAYELAFITMRKTFTGQRHGIKTEAWSSKLFVSMQFQQTVRIPSGQTHDTFQRPVSWIIYSFVAGAAMIVVSEEAEIVMSLLRAENLDGIHLISYNAPTTRKMMWFNNLKYLAFPALPAEWKAPSWLTIELGIFAGRLYFDYSEYAELLEYLGLACDADTMEISDASSKTAGFSAKPLVYLRDWLAVRRNGSEFDHSPIGWILQKKSLHINHPFFTQVSAAVDAPIYSKGPKTRKEATGTSGRVEEDDDAVEAWYDHEQGTNAQLDEDTSHESEDEDSY